MKEKQPNRVNARNGTDVNVWKRSSIKRPYRNRGVAQETNRSSRCVEDLSQKPTVEMRDTHMRSGCVEVHSGSPALRPHTCDISRSCPSTKWLFLSCSALIKMGHDYGRSALQMVAGDAKGWGCKYCPTRKQPAGLRRSWKTPLIACRC